MRMKSILTNHQLLSFVMAKLCCCGVKMLQFSALGLPSPDGNVLGQITQGKV